MCPEDSSQSQFSPLRKSLLMFYLPALSGAVPESSRKPRGQVFGSTQPAAMTDALSQSSIFGRMGCGSIGHIIRGAMSIETVIALLQQTIETPMEDLWIEREALSWHLQQAGYPAEELERIRADAKRDPELRERARAAYAQRRESLERAVKEVAIEAILEQPPPTGEPN
jgi:hypothetical protein